MQIKQSIVQTFNRKGYFATSTISQRQFHILMNTFIAKSHTVFDQNITQEIWKQSQQRHHQLINKNPPINTNTKITTNKSILSHQQQQQQPSSNTQFKCELIITILVDAIQILTNRILQCEQKLQQLKTKRQQLQQNQNFSKLQSIKQKIQTLTIDLKQFDKQFKMLTSPFMTQGSKIEFKKKISIKRNQSLGKRLSEAQLLGRAQTQHLKNLQEQKAKKAQQLPLTPRTIQAQKEAAFKQQKQCALYILLLMIVLELSVCLIKFNFANLLVELVVFLVLIEDNYLPSMLKIAFYSCMLSVVLDGGWLFMYSDTYIHSYYNSNMLHYLKPYHRYIWFVTLLQLFIKIIYLYLLKSYNRKIQQSNQQQKINQNEVILNDKYIPQVKRLMSEQQNNKNSLNSKTNTNPNNTFRRDKNLTIDINV